MTLRAIDERNAQVRLEGVRNIQIENVLGNSSVRLYLRFACFGGWVMNRMELKYLSQSGLSTFLLLIAGPHPRVKTRPPRKMLRLK